MFGSLLLILRMLVAIILYGFIGWALWTLWRDLKQESRGSRIPKIPVLKLSLEMNEHTEVVSFSSAVISIGRDPSNDCHLEDATISAHHARLSYHHKQWWIEDLDSTNGTFLNQESVRESQVVVSGDQLRCGRLILQVEIEEEI